MGAISLDLAMGEDIEQQHTKSCSWLATRNADQKFCLKFPLGGGLLPD
jgi:hypothetical protein